MLNVWDEILSRFPDPLSANKWLLDCGPFKHIVFWWRSVWKIWASLRHKFILWLAAQDKLLTGSLLKRLGVGNTDDSACVFCGDPDESCSHLFSL